MAPGRKIDPGEKFDWQMLHEAGVGHWVKPTEDEPELLARGEISRLQQSLRDYGYGIAVTGIEDAQTCKVLDAFRRHFRQSAICGPADRATFMTLQRLIANLPR